MKHVDPLQRQKRKKQAEEREREGGGKKGENKIKLESEEERRARLREKQVIRGEPAFAHVQYISHFSMGPVRIRHIVHTILGGSPVILWISLGGKPKWLPLKWGLCALHH